MAKQMTVLRHSASTGTHAGTTHLLVKGQPRTPCGLSVAMLATNSAKQCDGTTPTCATCAQAFTSR
jgi:hypothetical protein